MKVVVSVAGDPPTADLVLRPGLNLITGLDALVSAFPDLTTLERDLLTTAAAVFAADLASRRGEREGVTRTIDLTVPVVNYRILSAAITEITYALYFLSEDNWNLAFTPLAGEAEATRDWPDTEGTTLLFSGGLDSLAAAYKYLSASTPLTLVSHYTQSRTTRDSQTKLFDGLGRRFEPMPRWVRAHITGRAHSSAPFPVDADRENSQRTRSFMFVVLAGIVARRVGMRKIVCIAENGQMAIHLPLTAARIGAFSTHTAHPEFVATMADLLSTILGVPFQMENPFLYSTKAECVADVVRAAPELVRESISCWRASRQAETHCGQCIPCLIRRIALESHGMKLAEYARDILAEELSRVPGDDPGRRNVVELLEFVHRFRTFPSAALEFDFPDLISQFFDRVRAEDMYRRFAAEAEAVLSTYPSVLAIR